MTWPLCTRAPQGLNPHPQLRLSRALPPTFAKLLSQCCGVRRRLLQQTTFFSSLTVCLCFARSSAPAKMHADPACPQCASLSELLRRIQLGTLSPRADLFLEF